MDALNHPYPGITLQEEVIEPLHLTVSDAAEKLGVSRNAFSRMLSGNAAISLELAVRLEAAGVSTARFWTALQWEHDLAKAQQAAHVKVVRLMEPISV
ncbi:HigA family addiction module antidote protein [Candidimonas humi]|jgi:addiction module HigA family antidote|uniref:HigA family addiction module antitoxin n=1 Tax=Candidimonas humi TaxID=683355 RepID=A0ABV8P514_9BURK|nr:HigA family addiction module antitoxin [Candidimonas humi]MBV6307394.1 HigA family addiction module antidote protein [Candidimonas humi]